MLSTVLWSSLGSVSIPASFPQTPPHLVPAGGTIHVVCLCALVSSLCRPQALCRQTVQLESWFMEPGLGGGTWESRLVSGRIRRLLEKRWHGGHVQGDGARACDRAVGPGSPRLPGL